MSFLDKLPKFLPFSKPTEVSEYYFALNIGSDEVVASVWGVEGGRFRIVNVARKKYQVEADLIEAANFALDDALAQFQPEPTKILFGVPDSWLQDEEIKPEYLKQLRAMVRELDVVPMAYVSTSHAISHLQQRLTGVPVTGILVNITDPLGVTIVKAGKVVGSKMQKRTANIPEDIEKALLGFPDIEVLPSKILIYGEGNLTKFKEEMLSYPWMSQLPFLHLPRIDQLDEDISIKAISFAGASEIYPDITLHPQDLDLGMITPNGPRIGKPVFDEGASFKKDPSAMGFVAGDIGEVSKRNNFDGDQDLSEEVEENLNFQERGVVNRNNSARMGYEEEFSSGGRFLAPASGFLARVLDPLKKLGSKVGVGEDTRAGFPGMLLNKSILIPLVVLLVLILGVLFLPKAKVTVFMDLKILEKDATVIADPSVSSVSEADNKIPGKVVETDVSGSQKGQATGKKQVGDPAKGAVVLYNKTSGPKTLSSGSVLVGPNNLLFTLDSNVTVASQSAVEGGISFGKATANVTASEIGPDGNLPAGKELSVKGQSSDSVSAKVDSAFSGGVSKQVTVVTSDDQKRLLAALSSELRNKAQGQIQDKLPAGMKILPEALNEKILSQSYSKKINDPASEFSLDMKANYKGTAYNENDLKTIVSKLIQTTIPQGYDLDLSKTETQADVSKIEKDGTLVFLARFKAKLMPRFDQEKVKKDIAGRSVASAAERLKLIENVIGSAIEIKPTLPGPLKRLPLLPGNITIEITAK